MLSAMDENPFEPTKDDLAPLQGVVWTTASLVFAIFLILFARERTDLSDPVVAAIFAAVAVVVSLLIRRWVRDSFSEERLRRRGRKE